MTWKRDCFLNDEDGDDIEETVQVYDNQEPKCKYKTWNVSTKNTIAYKSEDVKDILLSLTTEFWTTIKQAIERVQGSVWAINRYTKMYSRLHSKTNQGRVIYRHTRHIESS